MIQTNELRGIIAREGKTQSDVARMLGITTNTFYSKMKRGVFLSDEISKMIEYLNIENPMSVFFAQVGTQCVTIE